MLYSYILVVTLFLLPAPLYCQGQGQESKSESPPLKVAYLEDYRKHAMARDGNPVAGEKLFSAKKLNNAPFVIRLTVVAEWPDLILPQQAINSPVQISSNQF